MAQVILAYSGGLHTSVCVHWLRREKSLHVIAVAANLGQKDSLREEADRAITAGAEAVHIIDLREKFVTDFIFKALKANARIQSGYLLTTALARPLICKELVKRAREENCRVIAHPQRRDTIPQLHIGSRTGDADHHASQRMADEDPRGGDGIRPPQRHSHQRGDSPRLRQEPVGREHAMRHPCRPL